MAGQFKYTFSCTAQSCGQSITVYPLRSSEASKLAALRGAGWSYDHHQGACHCPKHARKRKHTEKAKAACT